MTRATPAQQRFLLDLQATDTEVRRLEHRRSNLPEQQALDENADTLSRVTAEFAEAREELETVEKRQLRLEGEISTVDSRRKSEEGRMYSGLITSERELGAVRSELADLKSRKSALEDDLLAAMERREELESLVSSLKQRHGELTAQVEELTAARDEAASGIDAELEELRARRGAQVADIPAALLSAYEALRERKSGVAVAELHGRTCSGCHLELTAIEMEQVAEDAKDGLATCEQCERILIPAG